MKQPTPTIYSWFSACIILATLLLTPATAAAKLEVEFDVQPAAIRQNEAATATFTVHGVVNPPRPNLGTLQEFDVQNLGSRRTIYNGFPSTSYSYRLRPRNKGNFQIGPFLYKHGADEVTIPAKPLKVVGADEKTGLEIDNSDLIFATIQLAETNLYTQEYFDFDVMLHWRQLNLRGDVKFIDLETPGLQMGQFYTSRAIEKTINGDRYYVSRFRTKAKALAQGVYELKPTLRVDILVSGKFQLMREVKTIDVVVSPVTLHIHSPPEEGRPPSFRGAVGKYQFQAEISPLEMDEGTPITLRLLLSGSGNLDAALPPEVEDEKAFKIYDSRLTDDRLNESKSAGKRLFEQVIEARDPAITEIPALEFSFFDPETGRYETITRGPFPIVIHPATNQVSREIGPLTNLTQTQKKVLGEYIEYLKPLPDQWLPRSRGTGLSTLAKGLQAIPPILAVACFLIGRRKESLAGDVEKARKAEAPKIARAAIRKAQLALKENDASGFYTATSEALDGYLANKLNIGVGEVGADAISQRFDGEQHEEICGRINALLAEHDDRRFSPAGLSSSSDEEMQAHLDEVMAVLKACERIRV